MSQISLKVPVNPEYNFDLDPAEQFNYVNPVMLNNLIVHYANCAIEVFDKLKQQRKELLEVRIALRKSVRELEDLEYDILLGANLTKSDFKNLKDRLYFIRKTAKESEYSSQYDKARITCDELQDTVLKHEIRIESGEDMLKLINQLSSNVQTHLSYVKNEMFLNRGAHKHGT